MREDSTHESRNREDALVEAAHEMPSKVVIGSAKDKYDQIDTGQNSLLI
jgi:hypothetical protein